MGQSHGSGLSSGPHKHSHPEKVHATFVRAQRVRGPCSTFRRRSSTSAHRCRMAEAACACGAVSRIAPRQPPKSRLHEPKWAASRIRARVDRGCPAIRLSAPRATAAEGNRVNMKAGGNREGCICTRDALEGKAPQLVAPEAVGQAVGGGCRSGWGQLPSVTNAIEAGTCRQGDSGWA
jgi:hypothetical protein